MDDLFWDEIDNDLLDNGPPESINVRLAKAEQVIRELTAERDRLREELETAKEEQESEYFRGFRNAMAEVAVSVSCDIRMYRGQLWADKILAIIEQRDAATARAEAAEAALAEEKERLDWYDRHPKQVVWSPGYCGAASGWKWKTQDLQMISRRPMRLRAAIDAARGKS